MTTDRLEQAEFLTISEEAIIAINKLGNTKPQGAFRIRCNPDPKVTSIEFAWDDVFTRDDFMISIPHSEFEIVMDALSIAYILDEYLLTHDGYRFILSKNPAGAIRHQNR